VIIIVIKFEYRLNVNDIQEANQTHCQKGLLRYYLVLIGILLLISILPLIIQGGASISEILISVLLPNLLLLATVYFGISIARNFAIKRAWNSQTGMKSEMSVETFEDGLQINTALSESKMKWLIYTHWRETPNLFMVYQSSNCFNLFPKRAFSDDEQINEFRELLRVKLPNQ
jgi:hypothetical protein